MSDKTWEFLRKCGFKVDYTNEELAEFARIKETQEVKEVVALGELKMFAKKRGRKKISAEEKKARKIAWQVEYNRKYREENREKCNKYQRNRYRRAHGLAVIE